MCKFIKRQIIDITQSTYIFFSIIRLLLASELIMYKTKYFTERIFRQYEPENKSLFRPFAVA